jgi:hypothetical protein
VLGVWLKRESTCLAGTRPWVNPQYHKNNNKLNLHFQCCFWSLHRRRVKGTDLLNFGMKTIYETRTNPGEDTSVGIERLNCNTVHIKYPVNVPSV